MFENIIPFLILFVADHLLSVIYERLPTLRLPNWPGIFKSNISSQCDNPQEGGTRSGRRHRRCRRGRKGRVTEARSNPHQTVSLQEDTTNLLDDGAGHIADRSTNETSNCSSAGILESSIAKQCDTPPEGGTSVQKADRELGGKDVALEKRPDQHQTVSLQEDIPHEDVAVLVTDTDSSRQPTDVTNDCSSSGIFESNIPRRGEVVDSISNRHHTVRLQEGTQTCTPEDVAVHITDRCPDGSRQPTDVRNDCSSSPDFGANLTDIPVQHQRGSKETGWNKKKRELKSPWADWKQPGTERKKVLQKSKVKMFRYPYQVDGKSADDNNTNGETATPTLQGKGTTAAQSDKKQITSEQSPEVSSNDIKTPKESDGDKVASKRNDKTPKPDDVLPSDVLRISLVETVYESKDAVTGKPNKAGRKVTSPKSFERRRPFRPRASTRTPAASFFGRKRSPAEWQVAVIHKDNLGHKGRNHQRPWSPPTPSLEASVPTKNVLTSSLEKTTVDRGQLKEHNTKDQGPSHKTITKKTKWNEVVLRHKSNDVPKSHQSETSYIKARLNTTTAGEGQLRRWDTKVQGTSLKTSTKKTSGKEVSGKHISGVLRLPQMDYSGNNTKARFNTTTVGGGQLKEYNTRKQGPSPNTITCSTRRKDVTGRCSSDVSRLPQNDPSNNIKARVDTITVGAGQSQEQKTQMKVPGPETSVEKNVLNEVSRKDGRYAIKSPQTDPSKNTKVRFYTIDTTTVSGRQSQKQNTKEQRPYCENTTNKTKSKEVSGKDSRDVHKFSKTDPSNCTTDKIGAPQESGALQPSHHTTSDNTIHADEPPTLDTTGSSESNSDLTEKKRLAKMGRRQRARARKRLAQEAAKAAAQFTAQIVTSEDGEIVINKDFEFHFDCEEESITPISVKAEICPSRVSVPEWIQRHLPKNSYLGLKTSKTG